MMAATPSTDSELIECCIDADPNLPADPKARLRGYGPEVWALVSYWQARGFDAGQVAADYDLPLQAVQAALAYYGRHKALIDAQVAVNTV